MLKLMPFGTPYSIVAPHIKRKVHISKFNPHLAIHSVCYIFGLNKKKPLPKSSGRAFSMCTDTFGISVYLVSIPFSLMCSLTALMGTSSLEEV
jgi:hypothetical protein